MAFKGSIVNLVLLIVILVDEGYADSTISKKIPAHDSHWTYDMPETNQFEWDRNYPSCDGKVQSPINIITAKAKQNPKLKLSLKNYNDPEVGAFIENNGHTVQIGLSNSPKPSINGTATNGNAYIFQQMHFHWGHSDYALGSEHSIDWKHYPIELHLVHYNSKYGSFDASLNHTDGLTVLGVMLELSNENNVNLEPIVDAVRHIPEYKNKYTIPDEFDLRKLLPSNINTFFRYRGSLTTPPCSEIVNWIVFSEPIPVSHDQMEAFRNEQREETNPITGEQLKLVDNTRVVQPLNGRIVESSFTIKSNSLFDFINRLI